jgi:hypothetical protein
MRKTLIFAAMLLLPLALAAQSVKPPTQTAQQGAKVPAAAAGGQWNWPTTLTGARGVAADCIRVGAGHVF